MLIQMLQVAKESANAYVCHKSIFVVSLPFYAYESCQSVAIKLKNTNEIRNVSVHKNVAFFIVPWQ